MPTRLTIEFDDEELHDALNAAAHNDASSVSQIVSDAVREWLEVREDNELTVGLDHIRAEWERDGAVDSETLLGDIGRHNEV
jgi:predicted transcriptional regulator